MGTVPENFTTCIFPIFLYASKNLDRTYRKWLELADGPGCGIRRDGVSRRHRRDVCAVWHGRECFDSGVFLVCASADCRRKALQSAGWPPGRGPFACRRFAVFCLAMAGESAVCRGGNGLCAGGNCQCPFADDGADMGGGTVWRGSSFRHVDGGTLRQNGRGDQSAVCRRRAGGFWRLAAGVCCSVCRYGGIDLSGVVQRS